MLEQVDYGFVWGLLISVLVFLSISWICKNMLFGAKVDFEFVKDFDGPARSLPRGIRRKVGQTIHALFPKPISG